MDFVAIDFETANEQSSSACQLGAVVVRGGEEVASHCWWIRPRPMRFSSHNIAVHGITPGQVAGEAEFGELWSDMWDVLGDQILVAHNAGFDMGVLRSCLQLHQLPIPDMEFTCTRAIARKAWPNHSGFGLRAIADRLGISFRHHDALEDARACARILLAAGDKWGEPSLAELEQRLRVSRGRAGAWGCGGPRQLDKRSQTGGWTRSAYSRGKRSDGAGVYQRRLPLRGDAASGPVGVTQEQLAAWTEKARQVGSFEEKSVVFTGLLTRMERTDAERLTVAAGGKVGSSVSRQTQCVIVGKPDARTLRAGRSISTKEQRAMQLRDDGCNIVVLTEDVWFDRLLGADLPTEDPVAARQVE